MAAWVGYRVSANREWQIANRGSMLGRAVAHYLQFAIRDSRVTWRPVTQGAAPIT